MLEMLAFMFIISTLANWQAVETYHHGSIFQGIRAYLEAGGGFWSDMAECPYCLSHWTAFLLTTLSLALVCSVQAAPTTIWLAFPAFSLAVTRGSNILNDLTHQWCRTPNMVDTAVLPGVIDDLEDISTDRP